MEADPGCRHAACDFLPIKIQRSGFASTHFDSHPGCRDSVDGKRRTHIPGLLADCCDRFPLCQSSCCLDSSVTMGALRNEPRRVFRRLHFLRGWRHGKYVEEIFRRGPGASGTAIPGAGARARVPHALGSDAVDCWEDRVHCGDDALVGGLRGRGFPHVTGGQIALQRGYWDRPSFLRSQGPPLPCT